MQIVKPKDLKIREFNLYEMLDAFDLDFKGRKVKMGKAVMKPWVRVPEKGMNPHVGDEFSFIIKGSLVTGTKDTTTTVSSGDFSFIPKKTPHWSKNENNEDCELIWILIEDE